jgi:hypothetical protein
VVIPQKSFYIGGFGEEFKDPYNNAHYHTTMIPYYKLPIVGDFLFLFGVY